MWKFAVEFSGAAEGLGYNEVALKDHFNRAFDEPLSWWGMRGQDNLTFGKFVEFFLHDPQLRWLVCLRFWATKLQHPQWRPTKL